MTDADRSGIASHSFAVQITGNAENVSQAGQAQHRIVAEDNANFDGVVVLHGAGKP
ncbi:hypothetical protein [Sphingomonas faeni]|uniref:hypothetical protein n=1 Tax=Sphingomonas faeni TaxID=185950 RepID=UPI00335091D9